MPAEGTGTQSVEVVPPVFLHHWPSEESAVRNTASALVSFLVAASALAQPWLGGTVRDAATGTPLTGARVEIVASGRGTVTDASGAFALEAPAGAVTVVVSSPGYRVRRIELAAAPAEPMQIALDPVVSFSDRVEVTATRAREGVDAATFTNIPAEKVAETYWAQDPAILLASVAPGFYAYNDSGNGIGYSYFTIRGFGQARTRVTLNGAPLNDAESGELFFIDLADFLATAGDVQVQRGVFGLSGIGGAVDVTTRPPSVEPSFTLNAGFGSYGTRRYNALYDSGLIDGTWQLSARWSKITTDGYRDQSWVDMWNYYLALARLGERSSLRLVMFGGPEQTHLAYLGVPKSVLDGGLTGDPGRDRRYNPLTFPGEIDNFYQPHFQLLHALQIDPATQLDETFYFFRGNGYYEEYKTDRALVEYGLPDVVLPDGSVITSTDLVRRRTVSEWDAGWVPRLSHTGDSFSWSLGGEARLHRAHHYGDVRWAQFYPEGVGPDHRYYDYGVSKRTLALAANGSWRAAPRVTITGGLELARHTYELLDDEIKGISFTEPYTFVLPRLGAVFAARRGVDLYVSLARGMREPAFRTIYDPEDYYGTKASLDPEDVWDLEAGGSLRSGAWRARANVFYMRFANEIVYAGALDDSGVPIYGNGARSLHRGVELEGTWQPSPAFGADGALTLSRNNFTEYHEQWAPGEVVVYDGNRIAGYPAVLATATLRGSAGPATWSVAARYVGEFYLDNTEDNRRDPGARDEPGYVPLINPAFTVVDARVAARLPEGWSRALGLSHVELELRLNNLLDRTYTAFGYVDVEPQFTPAAGRNIFGGVTLGL
jgi:iron complex outermembrane receptor protein